MEALKREPVAVRTALTVFVAALVHLLVLLGAVDLSPAAETSIVTVVDLGAALVIILTVRPKVTPVDSPALTEGQITDLTVVNSLGNALPDVTVSTGRPDEALPVTPALAPDPSTEIGASEYTPHDRVEGPDHRAE